MSVTMRRMMLMACLLSPSLSWALGLGEIHLNSALNEPMNAEIDLIAATPDELTALRATLASREAFTHYGIDKPPFLGSMSFKVGKSKDGRDVLQVRTADAIPEPFVTFLVEVNWARGRLMREYTVLLDPPVYTPGENPNTAPPVSAATTPAAPTSTSARPLPVPAAPPVTAAPPVSAMPGSSPGSEIRVARGDTLGKIARGLLPEPVSPAAIDQTMISLYRSNPAAFGGNINVLRQGAILRVPGADQLASVSQREAVSEVHRQIEAWRESAGTGGSAEGHLRLVAPPVGGSSAGTAAAAPTAANNAAAAENQALKAHVKDLESQLAESKRLIELRSNELSALQKKLGAAPSVAPTPPPVAVPPVQKPSTAPTPPPVAAQPVPPPAQTEPPATLHQAPAVAPPAKPKAPPPADSGSWIDWVAQNWWVPVALLVLVLGALGFAAMRRRRLDSAGDMAPMMDETDVAEAPVAAPRMGSARRNPDSIVVEESGPHAMPHFDAPTSGRHGDTAELKAQEDTLSNDAAVNLDQGDPLAEADFHMAYGLYDQAADLVRIALEREPERRDLRLKLLEIYFVWGNKDAFVQTARSLESTRDRAPAGEWDKIVIMGKQICPDEPLFAASGGGRGAGALVDLNLEGGENRVDIDLFGDPEGERSTLDHQATAAGDHALATGESPQLHQASDHLDFTLDAPERGADDSPTREMPPRDEPTVESELMTYNDANLIEAPFFGSPAEAPTVESPALAGGDRFDRMASKIPAKADQTAEVSIDDLGLDLDHLEETGTVSTHTPLEQTDHPDEPTMMAGLDERSRRMMADAEMKAKANGAMSGGHATDADRDLTQLERELEASFISELDPNHDQAQTAVRGADAPTMLEKIDVDSTSKLRGIHADSIDLDLDRLASALGSGDTLEQPRAAEDLFSQEVFETADRTARNKVVDLDVGDPLFSVDSPTNKLTAQTNKLKAVDLEASDLEPVTMSEVGTKLDLARAYMDMGDPEGARSILEEVVQEGSASQKQEASRLMETLPG